MARRPHYSAPLLLLALLARAPAVGGGRVFAVGSNGCGQLGDGTRTSAATPTEITSGYDPTTRGRVNLTNAVRQVDASSGDDPAGATGYTLLLTHDGKVLASGYNNFFQLIDEQSVPSTREPVVVANLSSRVIVQLAAGLTHSLFLDDSGVAWAVGFNSFGQLGVPVSSAYNRVPQEVPCGREIAQVATNQAGSHSLFRTADGRVLASGLNDHGQLGIGTLANEDAPTPVLSPDGEPFTNDTAIVMVAAGKAFSLLLDDEGAVFSVGSNDRGQLGIGDALIGRQQQRLARVSWAGVAPAPRIVHMAAGSYHSLFCDDTGRIFATGDHRRGQLGDARDPNFYGRRGTPVELVKRWDSPGFEDGATCASTGPPDQRSCVRHVAAGAQSSFFRVESGDVFAAGVNVANQLGGSWDDSGGQLIVPKKLHDLADDAGSVPLALPVAQLASAGSHTVFLSAECSNAPSPCHAAGTAACVDIQTEATAPAFSFGCHCREGWANGVCADGSIPDVAHLCNVTLEGRCEVDVEECASSPCQHGTCDDSASCASKLANDVAISTCEYGDEECERREAAENEARRADNCPFDVAPDEFMCTCEDDGVWLGSYTSAEIGRPAVGDEDPTAIPTAMEPGLTCDLRIGPSVVLWVGVGVLGLVALLLCLFFCVVLKMKRTEKSKNLKVHP